MASSTRESTAKKTADGGGFATPPAAVYQGVQVGRDLITLVVNVARATAAPRFQNKIQSFLEEYLVSETGPVPFGGRDAELLRLDRWLQDDQAPSRLLVTAPAGRGKSALLVRWLGSLQKRGLTEDGGRGWHVVFVPISIRVGTNLPSVFYAALATRLAGIVREPLSASATDADAYYADQAAGLLRRVAAADRRVLVVIDGIDEALHGRFDAGIFPRVAPPGLKFLLSARLQADDTDASGWLRRLRWEIGVRLEPPLELAALDPDRVADVLMRMGAPLDVLSARQPLFERLTYLSEGEPLLLRYYAEDLWKKGEAAARLRVEELDAMKPGFAAYFERWLDDQQVGWRQEGVEIDRARIDATLAVLACAFGPLKGKDLVRLTHQVHGGQAVLSTDHLLEPLRRFVMGVAMDEDSARSGYVLNHPKIAGYLREKYRTAGTLQKALGAFADWGRETIKALDTGGLPPEQTPAYLLQFHAQHLKEVDASLDDFMALVADAWRRAWYESERGYGGFAHDVHVALSQVGNLQELADPERSQALIAKIRCVLCLSSICSSGNNVPADLLPLAVTCEALTIGQALHLADLKAAQGPGNRIQALVALAPHLKEEERLALLNDIETLSNEENRAQVLIQLAVYLPAEERQAALGTARAIASQRLRPDSAARVLRSLLPLLLEEEDRATVASRAQSLAEQIDHGYTRATVLADVTLYLLPDQAANARRGAIDAARSVPDTVTRAKALVEVALRLPDDSPCRPALFNEAISAADQVLGRPNHTDPHRRIHIELAMEARACALAGLAQREADVRRRDEGFDAAVRTARSAPDEYSRVRLLTELISHLPDPKRAAVIEDTVRRAQALRTGNNRTHALTRLVPLLSPSRQREAAFEALQAAHLIEDGYDRFLTFISIAKHTEDTIRVSAVSHARAILGSSISYVLHRADALAALAPYLAPHEQERALETALRLAMQAVDPSFGVSTIVRLVPRLPQRLQLIAVRHVLDNVASSAFSALNLVQLAIAAPASVRRVVVIRTLKHLRREPNYIRSSSLLDLAPIFTGTRKRRILKGAKRAIVTLPDPAFKARKLAELLLHLPWCEQKDAFQDIVDGTATIADRDKRAATLVHAVTALPENWRLQIQDEAYRTAKACHSQAAKAQALAKLAPYLSQREAAEATALAFEAAKAVNRDQGQLGTLFDVVPLLRGEQRLEALDPILHTCARLPRSRACSAIRHLPSLLSKGSHVDVLPAAMDALDEVAEWFP